MKVNQVSDNQNFTGNVIVKGAISVQQKHLFDLHRHALEHKIKDMPFDLFVEQSKSKKTITLSTNVKDTKAYFVRKNQQNFEEVADFAIADAKHKTEIFKKTQKINEMFNYQKMSMMYIVAGKFKEARESEKQLAKLAVKDFDNYKTIPNIKITDAPFELGVLFAKQSLKYRVYRAFSPKTQEEKQFLQMKKDYYNELKSQNKQPKVQEISIRQFL